MIPRPGYVLGALVLATGVVAASALYHSRRARRPQTATSCPCGLTPKPRVLVATPIGVVLVNECSVCGDRELLRDGHRVGRRDGGGRQ